MPNERADKPSAHTDDRGAPIRAMPIADLVRESATPDDLEARRRLAKWLTAASRHMPSMRRRSPSHAASLVMSAIILFSCINVRWLQTQFGIVGVFFPWFLIFIAFFVERRLLPRLHSSSAPSLVAEGFCGQCAYSMKDLPTQPDGCIVCPECGAAWSASRMTWAWWDHEGPPWSRAHWHPAELFTRSAPARAGLDAAGRIVPILTVYDMRTLARQEHPPEPSIWHDAERAVSRVKRTSRWITAGATFMLFFALGTIPFLTALESLARLHASDFLCPGVLWFIGIVIALTVLGSGMYITPSDVARTITPHGVCPTCCGALGEGPASPASRTVCAACGSTWIRSTPTAKDRSDAAQPRQDPP